MADSQKEDAGLTAFQLLCHGLWLGKMEDYLNWTSFPFWKQNSNIIHVLAISELARLPNGN